MVEAVPSMPLKPNKPATIAIIKNTSAQYNIFPPVAFKPTYIK